MTPREARLESALRSIHDGATIALAVTPAGTPVAQFMSVLQTHAATALAVEETPSHPGTCECAECWQAMESGGR